MPGPAFLRIRVPVVRAPLAFMAPIPRSGRGVRAIITSVLSRRTIRVSFWLRSLVIAWMFWQRSSNGFK